MSPNLDLDKFLSAPGTIIDVRSPLEYEQGRIPHSINNPLFTDTERSIIGTLYKQKGSSFAMDQGLKIVQSRFYELIKSFEAQRHPGQNIKIYCWRGGMRSRFVGNVLNALGIPTMTLEGGYKTFRRWVLQFFQSFPAPLFHLMGGLTGCGKTDLLRSLREKGEQFLDLEFLANHRGSAFGGIGFSKQPTTEQFENEIAIQLKSFDFKKPIWVEDESRMIGTCKIPDALFKQMSVSPLFIIEKPLSERLQQLLADYEAATDVDLISATQKIAKKLGSAKTKKVIQKIREGCREEAFASLLEYYDKAYRYSYLKRLQNGGHLLSESIFMGKK
jgi:tRNA 2-selenouridine synthase